MSKLSRLSAALALTAGGVVCGSYFLSPAPAQDKQKAPVPPTNIPPAKQEPKDERSRLERLLTGRYVPNSKLWSGRAGVEGGMVRAFYDKDSSFEPRMKDEREGEQAAVLAWAKAPSDVRKKAYDEGRIAR